MRNIKRKNKRKPKKIGLATLDKACARAHENLYQSSQKSILTQGEAVKEWKNLYGFICKHLDKVSTSLSRNPRVFNFLREFNNTMEAMDRKSPRIDISRGAGTEGVVRILDDSDRIKFGTRCVSPVDVLYQFGITSKTPGYYTLICYFSWEQDALDAAVAYMDYNAAKLQRHLFVTENDKDKAI